MFCLYISQQNTNLFTWFFWRYEIGNCNFNSTYLNLQSNAFSLYLLIIVSCCAACIRLFTFSWPQLIKCCLPVNESFLKGLNDAKSKCTMHARNTRNKESPYENDVANELVDYLKKITPVPFREHIKKVVYTYIEANTFKHRANT